MSIKLAPIGAVVLRGLCLVALGSVGWLLLATTTIGAITGWDRTVIISGSMEPSLRVGDVVLNGPPEDDRLGVHSVVTFERHDGESVSHRVVSVDEDGRLLTRGDANRTIDSDPVSPDDVDGVGRLVVPLVGIPQVWIAEGRVLELVLLGVALIALAVGGLVVRPAGDRSGAPKRPRAAAEPRSGRWRAPGATIVRPVLLIAGLLVVIISTLQLQVASGAFVATSQVPVSSLGAAPSFCTAGSMTVTSVADTMVREDDANAAFGTQTTMEVRSRHNNRNRRALVRFDLPVAPSRCQLESATLRLFATGSSPGRTIEVRAASAGWTEAVTWNSQPGTTGDPSSAASGTGWRTWNVTGQVVGQMAGANQGFVLRDATEGTNGPGRTQTYSSREGASPPELLLTWTAAP